MFVIFDTVTVKYCLLVIVICNSNSKNYIASLNIIPTLHPTCRRQLAFIAVGKEANHDISFYASVSQFKDETEHPHSGFQHGRFIEMLA